MLLAILIIFFKNSASLTTVLKCFHKTLSGLEVDELLHLSMTFVNVSFKKEGHTERGFNRIFFKMFILIY